MLREIALVESPPNRNHHGSTQPLWAPNITITFYYELPPAPAQSPHAAILSRPKPSLVLFNLDDVTLIPHSLLSLCSEPPSLAHSNATAAIKHHLKPVLVSLLTSLRFHAVDPNHSPEIAATHGLQLFTHAIVPCSTVSFISCNLAANPNSIVSRSSSSSRMNKSGSYNMILGREVFVELLRVFYDVTMRVSALLHPNVHTTFYDVLSMEKNINNFFVAPEMTTGYETEMILVDMTSNMKSKYLMYFGSFKDLNCLVIIELVLDAIFKLRNFTHLMRGERFDKASV
ncbi:hypothetical protein M0R45_033939 [Rubus argutus]|uniref:Uncharacterized protein n=1 Tax=Rubus argutus TaxID=59490 RepID=A0AAW1VPP2_RUBAR